MGTTLLLSVGVGVLLGLLAAVWVRTWKDHVISVAAIIAYAMPLFWIGLMLILVFSIKLDWLPTSGMEDAAAFYEGWERVVDIAKHLVLPSDHAVAVLHGALCTPDARHHARAARPRLRHHRTRQGADRTPDHRAPHGAQCAAAGGDGRRRAGRRPARRLGGGRSPCSPGLASASSPSSRCSHAISISCSASSSSPRAWWWSVNIIVDIVYLILDPRIRVG